MSPHNYSLLSWFLAIAAFIIIAAACFAPWLFSKPGCIDLTATGEIGDTIGGTMSPFVGIAGVLMTFVAFMMQVRANEIQREQLGKSFSLKEMESKIEDRRAMELLKLDVDNAISDIEERSNCIDVFCKKIEENPFDDVPLMRPSFLSLSRYQSIDRNRVFNALKTFVENDGTSLFQRTYSCLDYYYEAVKQVNNEMDKNWEKDVDKRKSEISELYKNFSKRIDMRIFHPCDTVVNELLKKFKEECGDIIVDDEPDIKHLNIVLVSPHNGIEDVLYESGKEALIDVLDAFRANNLSHSKMMKDAAAAFRSDKCLDALKDISDKLETALKEHTEQKIIFDFEKKTGLYS